MSKQNYSFTSAFTFITLSATFLFVLFIIFSVLIIKYKNIESGINVTQNTNLKNPYGPVSKLVYPKIKNSITSKLGNKNGISIIPFKNPLVSFIANPFGSFRNSLPLNAILITCSIILKCYP